MEIFSPTEKVNKNDVSGDKLVVEECDLNLFLTQEEIMVSNSFTTTLYTST